MMARTRKKTRLRLSMQAEKPCKSETLNPPRSLRSFLPSTVVLTAPMLSSAFEEQSKRVRIPRLVKKPLVNLFRRNCNRRNCKAVYCCRQSARRFYSCCVAHSQHAKALNEQKIDPGNPPLGRVPSLRRSGGGGSFPGRPTYCDARVKVFTSRAMSKLVE